MDPKSCILKERLSTALENNTLSAECQNIASEILKGDVKLYNFVEGLQPLLTNTDVELRKQSIQALSSLLVSLPLDFLNEAELNFIIGFYCDRLKDHYSILPATLKGILSIIKMLNLPENTSERLLTSIFQHVQCQTLLLPDRQIVYCILDILLRFKSSKLKSLNQDLVYGFINSIDGESDPRNLLIIFRIIPFFVKEYPLGHLTEEMFEVIACYFPVHYNTPKSEGCGITRDNLADALAPCLYAIPEFAEFCLPLLVEKLDSNLKVAKLDSLKVLTEGAESFGAKQLEPYMREIWQVLQKEIMQSSDCEVKNSALKCTTSLIKALAKDSSVSSDFVQEIIINAKWTLCNAPASSIKNAETLLQAVAKASKEICEQVLCAVVPVCLQQYSTKTNSTDKIFLIETFNDFITIANQYELSIKNIPDLAWSDVPSFYLEELNCQVPEILIRTMQGLIEQRSSLNETQRAILYEKIFEKIETGNEITIQAANSCLYSFTELFPEEVLSIITTRFELNDNNVSKEVISRRIEALSLIAKIPKIGNEILPKIVTAAITDNVEINLVALSCLQKLLTIKIPKFDIGRFLYKQNVIDELLKTGISGSDEKICLISNICRRIVRKLNTQEQKDLLQKYNKVLEGVVSDNDVTFIDGILISLRPDIELKYEQLVKNSYEIAVKSLNATTRLAACHLIAVLVNKLKLNQEYEQTLDFLKNNIKNCLESKEVEIDVKKAASVLLIWLTKSLVKKGSPDSQEILNYQLSILRHTEIGNYVASEFKILIDNNDNILTEDNFCQVKILYKQRIFENIIRESSDSAPEFKDNYLTALIHTSEQVPIELLLMYLNQLVACFVNSLNVEELIIPTLNVIQPLLETKNAVFIKEAKYFISKFLDLSLHKMMKIRMTAINCLIIYAQYPSEIVQPFKLDVVEKLHLATDDKKRLVRKLAVKARMKWFLMDSAKDQKSK